MFLHTRGVCGVRRVARATHFVLSIVWYMAWWARSGRCRPVGVWIDQESNICSTIEGPITVGALVIGQFG